MPDELPVHINRTGLHSLEVPADFETDGSFDLRLINHGEALHVHVHLNDGLSEVASIDAGNHYVEGNSQRSVRVDIDESVLSGEAIWGKIKVASGYGARTRWIDVSLVEPEEEPRSVTVDESLAQPQSPPEPESTGGFLERPEIPVIALGMLALLVAAAAALVIENTIVLLGALVVLGGVLVALYVLFSQ